MSDKQNSKWRQPPSWIFLSILVTRSTAADNITAKFHSSTSISSQVIHHHHHHDAKRSAVAFPVAICRQNERSSASCRASVTDIPVSRQIWWIQVMGGRPRARFQSGGGRAPSWASQQVQRIKSLLFVQKFKMALAAILDFIFVQYFGIGARRTSSVIHMPNFVQICATVNELWAINKIQNDGRRHLDLLFLTILVKLSIFGDSHLHFCKISFIYINQWLSYCCLCKNPRWWPPPSWILFLFNILACVYVGPQTQYTCQISCKYVQQLTSYKRWMKFKMAAAAILN